MKVLLKNLDREIANDDVEVQFTQANVRVLDGAPRHVLDVTFFFEDKTFTVSAAALSTIVAMVRNSVQAQKEFGL